MKRIITILLLALTLSGCAAQSHSSAKGTKGDALRQEDPSGTATSSLEQPAPTKQATATYRSISMDEFAHMRESESGYILLDVRRPDEFAEGHIKGAINIANETIDTQAPLELPDKAQLIFVYCRSGRRSKEAAEKLAGLGYTSIVEIGGILDWKGEIVK